MDWVETTCSLVPEAAADLAALGRLYEGKLYHELTLALETFVNDPGHQGRGRLLLDLEDPAILGRLGVGAVALGRGHSP